MPPRGNRLLPFRQERAGPTPCVGAVGDIDDQPMATTLPQRGAMTRFLVVGARGFIGHWVLDALRAEGEAVGLSRLDVPGLEQVLVTDPDRLAAAIDDVRPDVIVNAAGALSGTDEEMEEANVTLVRHLLAEVRDRDLRFVQIGSASEIGNPHSSDPLAEDVPCHPLTTYGETKLRATSLVAAAHADGVAATVARVFNTVGPRQTVIQPIGDVVRRMRELPPTGGRLPVGNATVVRDFVSVGYVARAVLALATVDAVEPLVNVSSGHGHSVADLVRAMVELQGVDAEIVDLAEPAISHVIGNADLLEKLTGLRDAFTLTDLARAALDADSDPVNLD